MNENFFQAFDLIAVPTFVLDVEGEKVTFRRLNAAHETMTGLSTAAVAGKTPAELFPPRLAETLSANYLGVVASRTASFYEEVLSFGNGEEWWQTTLLRILDVTGAVAGIVGTAINITVQKRAEMERAEQIARAHALNEEIERTIALAAHDLKSPLENIQSMIRLVKKDFVDLKDGKLDLLDKIETIGAGAARFVEDILQYRETAEIAVALTRFDVGHICADVLALLDPLSRHFVHFNHIEIESDAVALQIVMRNLIDNAFRNAHRKDLMVAIDVVEERPGMLTFTVGDNGFGLADVTALTGGDSSETTSSHSLDYGLRGVRRLVRSRGGDVWLGTPIFTAGATIQFTLPGKVVDERILASGRLAA